MSWEMAEYKDYLAIGWKTNQSKFKWRLGESVGDGAKHLPTAAVK